MNAALPINRKGNSSRAARRACVFVDVLEPRRLLSANVLDATTVQNAAGLAPTHSATADVAGYTPAQIRQTYGFNQVTFSDQAIVGDGAGQTLAIVEAYDDPDIAGDLQAFDQQFSLPDPPVLSKFDQVGGTKLPAADAGWSRETALDVEWSHAIAPGANIVIVEARSDRLNDLLTAVDTARHLAGVSVVSMSWGTSEFPAETTLDDVFTTPADHSGVTFVASSGDVSAASGVQWPSSSPNVLAVGGTTLYVRSADNSASIELPWSGSIGGTSSYEPRPVYQGPAASPGRVIPDVAYNADPLTGYAMFDSVPFEGDVGWQIVGGTSAAAPQWAALVAIANQGRALNGMSSLDGPNDTLPALYQFYGAQDVSSTAPSAIGATPAAPFAGAPASPLVAPGTLISIGGAALAGRVVSSLAITRPAELPPAQNPPQASVPVGQRAPSQRVNFFAIPLLNVTRAVPLPKGFALSANSSDEISTIGSLEIGVTAVLGGSAIHVSTSLGTWTVHFAGDRKSSGLAEAWMAAQRAAGGLAHWAGALASVSPSAFAPAMIEPVSLPIVRLPRLHVPHLEVAALFSDRVWSFISESAAVEPLANGMNVLEPGTSHLRAWAITAAVLATDALLLGYAYRRRIRFQIAAMRITASTTIATQNNADTPVSMPHAI